MSFDPKKAAVLIVDLQNDFLDPMVIFLARNHAQIIENQVNIIKIIRNQQEIMENPKNPFNNQ